MKQIQPRQAAMLKQCYLIYDTQTQLYFKTVKAMAAPVESMSGRASVYREPQAKAICDSYYGPGQWGHVEIRKANKMEQMRYLSTLGGKAKSVKKTLAVRLNAKMPRRRLVRPPKVEEP